MEARRLSQALFMTLMLSIRVRLAYPARSRKSDARRSILTDFVWETTGSGALWATFSGCGWGNSNVQESRNHCAIRDDVRGLGAVYSACSMLRSGFIVISGCSLSFYQGAQIPLRPTTSMAPHTIRLTTPWEAISQQNASLVDRSQRLSLPICMRSDELTTAVNLVRRFHAPPAVTRTTRIFLRIVLDQGHLRGVLNGTELSECSSADSVICHLQSAAVQEIRPSIFEITSTIQAYNQLKLLIFGPVGANDTVIPAHEIRLLWVSLEIVEAEDV